MLNLLISDDKHKASEGVSIYMGFAQLFHTAGRRLVVYAQCRLCTLNPGPMKLLNATCVVVW